MMLGGDARAPVGPILSSKGTLAVVLDVGCGPGAWAMEMATVYPNASFIGIDRDMYFPCDIKPKNCHFRQFEITDGKLPFPDNSFDYIHQRDLNWALTTDVWKTLMAEYLRVLKPGGWIELVEPDVETKSSLPMECAMNDKRETLVIQGMAMRQQNPHMARHLSTILAVNGFRRVQSQFQSLPLGWYKEEDGDPTKIANCPELARLTASQYLFLLQSLRPWLSLVMNLAIDKFNSYIMKLPQEWRQGNTYINWHCAVAQKPRNLI
ncbi:S-adenosyl-L-methionine-dependent methyltransferase [Dichotomocladium elegans]|nr:S-adenosyl-L-methionine-dependent methyltransferase [Dichotomocladium elegans]